MSKQEWMLNQVKVNRGSEDVSWKPEEKGYIMAAVSAVILSTISPMGKVILGMGIDPMVVVAYRASMACLLLSAGLALRRPDLLKAHRKDLLWLALLGLASGLNQGLSFYALKRTSAAVMIVLLYTYPAFLTLMERFFQGKAVGKQKSLALLLTLVGCFLVTEAYKATFLSNLGGFLAGLGSGIALAAYTMVGKNLTSRYEPLTVNLYGFGFAGLFLILAASPQKIATVHLGSLGWAIILYLAVVPSILGYSLFIAALRYLDASKAGIICMLEPALTAIWGWIFLREFLTPVQVIGVITVILGVGSLKVFGSSSAKDEVPITEVGDS